MCLLICLDYSKWLPKYYSFKIISLRFLPSDAKVVALLREYGAWNSDLLNQSFITFEAKQILSIPQPCSLISDRI